MDFPGLTDIVSTLKLAVQAINLVATNLGKAFTTSGGTATTATAGTASLPANPAKFLIVTLPDGTTGKIPIYNT